MPDYLHWLTEEHLASVTTDPFIQSWLTTPISLTARIRQHCPQMHVEILSEQQEAPLADEYATLAPYITDNTAWVRCVLLKCDAHAWVYARTVIPKLTAENPWYRLQTLGNQPLGEVLFELPNVQRNPFEFAATPLEHWSQLHPLFSPITRQTFGYARRSIFMQQGFPLLLTEVFLPGLAEIAP